MLTARHDSLSKNDSMVSAWPELTDSPVTPSSHGAIEISLQV